MKLLTYIIAIIVILADQLSKYALKGKSIKVASFFWINFTENMGGAFSLFQGARILFIIIAIIIIVILVRYIKYIKKPILAISFGFMLGGIMGNLIDRIFLGHVIDFIDFRIWPVFNLADTFIVIGIILLISYSIKGKKLLKKPIKEH